MWVLALDNIFWGYFETNYTSSVFLYLPNSIFNIRLYYIFKPLDLLECRI